MVISVLKFSKYLKNKVFFIWGDLYHSHLKVLSYDKSLELQRIAFKQISKIQFHSVMFVNERKPRFFTPKISVSRRRYSRRYDILSPVPSPEKNEFSHLYWTIRAG